jgi:di/tricarboxylate transporter
MTLDQTLIAAILAATVALFLWGRWRHDMVALAALIACVVAGLVPGEEAFAGFGHTAVITVACVLVLSRGLQTSGAVDVLSRRLMPADAGPTVTIAVLTGLAAALSAFMNNVGALALLMPVAIQAAQKTGLPPGRVLMPLAFGSILGGMTTLIGTPPNLIVSAFRADALGQGYGMFDFTPVGLAVALAGLVFIVLVGWRLVPRREPALEGFDAGRYLTEARVPEKAKAVGMTLAEAENAVAEADVQVLGLIRYEFRLRAPRPGTRIRAGDILVLQADPEGLSNALVTLGMRLEEDVAPPKPEKVEAEAEPEGAAAEGGEPTEEGKEEKPKPAAPAEDSATVLAELVVTPVAPLIGRSAAEIDMRARYHINLLAIAREGRRALGRLRNTRIAASDVLLVQGTPETIAAFAADQGCLPLAERPLRLPDRRQMVLAAGILIGAVVVASTGLVSTAVAFAAGVLAAMVTKVVPPRAVYGAIDWPVIVLLGCLLPVAGAMQTTGLAERLAALLVEDVAGGAPVIALVLILIVTMTLSDVMNNAATVAVMAPVALGIAASLGANPDAFLMAVAIGGSCAFLTPIGHQNNTLILGPGGLRFGDYWRLGLPVEVLVVAVAVPVILLVWGL